MRTEYGRLPANRLQVAEDVRRVGVLRGEPQRSPFAAATDDDGQVLLQWARVARGDRYLEDLAVKRLAARAPHLRQQPECILQEDIPLSDRRELPAVGDVLLLEPGEPEAAHRPSTGEDVQGRDDLSEMWDV